MKNRSTLSLLVITSVVALSLLALLVWGVYGIRSKNNETSLLLQEADSLAEESILLQSVRATRNTARVEIAELERLVLNEAEIVGLIETIESVGRSQGLETEFDSVSVEEESKPTRTSRNASSTPAVTEPRRVELVVESRGPRTGTLQFMRIIESLPYRVVMRESVMNEEDEGWYSKISFAIYLF